jgi:hypothetical protein
MTRAAQTISRRWRLRDRMRGEGCNYVNEDVDEEEEEEEEDKEEEDEEGEINN